MNLIVFYQKIINELDLIKNQVLKGIKLTKSQRNNVLAYYDALLQKRPNNITNLSIYSEYKPYKKI